MDQRMLLLIFVQLSLAIHGSLGGAHAARGDAGKAGMAVKQYCSGWISNTDSNNIVGWKVTPPICQKYIKNYIEKGQYMVDFSIAVNASYTFLQTLEPTDGKDAMVFDIDETALSNLPYYKKHSYGGELFNATTFNDYVNMGTAPPLLSTLALYKELQAQNWVLILITGRDEIQRNITTANLIAAGYTNWNELILRQIAEKGLPASIYKSNVRVALEKAKGYQIRSCIGDQWSDCQGAATGNRTFKLPNPMYYIA